MRTIKFIGVLLLIVGLASCAGNKELRKAQKEEDQTEKTLEKQAKSITKDLTEQGYKTVGLVDLQQSVLNYLRISSQPGSIAEETSVIAPTENLGKTKCIVNIKSRVAKIVCDSIRYRVDEAVGGDGVTQQYIDSFFAASEHLGILNLGAPDCSFTITRKVSKTKTEYVMFAVYSSSYVNNMVTNGAKFGNQIKEYIDKGFEQE